ncbi:glycosyltransferase family 2 protein, partial [Helicobacter typhlonius]
MRDFKPQDKPLVSVIIPIYNVEKYVAQCLDSIISQSYTNLEIICVNDGSTDSSGEIVQEYAQRDCRICYFEQENQGLGGARNKGLDEAQGEYIYFIDSDDYIDLGYIEGLVDKCNVGITPIQTKMFFVRGDKLEIYNLHLGKKGNFMLNPSLMPFLSFHIVNVLLQAAIIKTYHIRFLLSQGAEDSEFFYRYIIFAPNICFIDTGAYYYRQRQDSILDLFRNSGNFPLEPLESFKTIYSWYKQYEVLEKYGLPFKLLYSFDLHSKNAENYYESAKN